MSPFKCLLVIYTHSEEVMSSSNFFLPYLKKKDLNPFPAVIYRFEIAKGKQRRTLYPQVVIRVAIRREGGHREHVSTQQKYLKREPQGEKPPWKPQKSTTSGVQRCTL